MHSRFKLFPMILILGLSFCFVFIIIDSLINFNTVFTSLEAGIFIYIFIGFAIIFLSYELRKKVIKVDFENDKLIVQYFLGLSAPKRFKYSDIDGFKTSKVYSKLGTFNYLYIMVGKNKIAILSDFYHSNYSFLLIESQENLTNLGYVSTNFFSELNDILKK